MFGSNGTSKEITEIRSELTKSLTKKSSKRIEKIKSGYDYMHGRTIHRMMDTMRDSVEDIMRNK